MENSSQLKKRNETLKATRIQTKKQRFFKEVLNKCEQQFNPSDFDFFVRYVMAKKATYSTHRVHKSLNFNPSISLWSDQEFQLKTISPLLFQQKRSKPFAQNEYPKGSSKKEKKNRMVTSPVGKKNKTIELKDFNLFSLEKKMREKKKCLKTKIRQIEATFRQQRKIQEPEYSFRRKFTKRKFNQTEGNYFNSPKYERIQSNGCQVPFQLLVPLEVEKKSKLKFKNMTHRNTKNGV